MQELMEGRHEPPSPSAAPRRSSLKGGSSNNLCDLQRSTDKEDTQALSDSCSLSSDAAMDAPLTDRSSTRRESRRASWCDDHGHDLQMIHHGAAPAT